VAIVFYLLFDFTVTFKALFLNKIKHWFGIKWKPGRKIFFLFFCLPGRSTSFISQCRDESNLSNME